MRAVWIIQFSADNMSMWIIQYSADNMYSVDSTVQTFNFVQIMQFSYCGECGIGIILQYEVIKDGKHFEDAGVENTVGIIQCAYYIVHIDYRAWRMRCST